MANHRTSGFEEKEGERWFTGDFKALMISHQLRCREERWQHPSPNFFRTSSETHSEYPWHAWDNAKNNFFGKQLLVWGFSEISTFQKPCHRAKKSENFLTCVYLFYEVRLIWEKSKFAISFQTLIWSAPLYEFDIYTPNWSWSHKKLPPKNTQIANPKFKERWILTSRREMRSHSGG